MKERDEQIEMIIERMGLEKDEAVTQQQQDLFAKVERLMEEKLEFMKRMKEVESKCASLCQLSLEVSNCIVRPFHFHLTTRKEFSEAYSRASAYKLVLAGCHRAIFLELGGSMALARRSDQYFTHEEHLNVLRASLSFWHD